MIFNKELEEKYQFIYEKYWRLIFYIANTILEDYELAEDAMQNTLFYLALNFKKIREFDMEDTKVKNYICIVAKHKALDIVRKRKKEKMVNIEEYIPIANFNMEEKVIQSLEIQEILEVIRSFPQIDKELLELYLVYEYRSIEIAKLTGLSYVQTRKRLQRAKEKLKKRLGEDFYKK